MDKHSSLFARGGSDEEKTSPMTLTPARPRRSRGPCSWGHCRLSRQPGGSCSGAAECGCCRCCIKWPFCLLFENLSKQVPPIYGMVTYGIGN